MSNRESASYCHGKDLLGVAIKLVLDTCGCNCKAFPCPSILCGAFSFLNLKSANFSTNQCQLQPLSQTTSGFKNYWSFYHIYCWHVFHMFCSIKATYHAIFVPCINCFPYMFAGLSEKRRRKENQGRVSWLEDILLGFVSDHSVVMILGVFV